MSECKYDKDELVFELEQLLTQDRMEQEDFLLDYISESYRNQEVSQYPIELDHQTVMLHREITYGDIGIISCLVFFISFYVGNKIYSKIRELF